MNTHILIAATLVATLLVSNPALAHDPKLHKDSNEKPNCKAMQDMDHSKMDMDDPVMQAMMKKCADAHPADSESGDDQPNKDVPADENS